MTIELDFEKFRKKLAQSTNLGGPLLTIPDPTVVETILYADPDLIIVDMEHSAISAEQLPPICMASGNVPVLARIRGLEKDEIKKVLDTGVYGIIVPGIETAEDAMNAVKFSRFAPVGRRGAGPGRASGYGNKMKEYLKGEPLVFVQIETESAYSHVREIAETKGLDGLFIGPFDLSIALGLKFSWDDSQFLEAVRKIHDAADYKKLLSGIYSPLEKYSLRRTSGEGFNFIMLGMDREAIVSGYHDAFERLRGNPD